MKKEYIIADRFVIGTFDVIHGFHAYESGDELGSVLAKLPEHLAKCDDRISVCEVVKSRWRLLPGGDSRPAKLRLLYEVHHYEDPLDDEELSEAG